MRYVLKPHRHSESFPFDGGWAVFDTLENRQTGWWEAKDRAMARVEERNGTSEAEEQRNRVVPNPPGLTGGGGRGSEGTAETNAQGTVDGPVGVVSPGDAAGLGTPREE